MTMDVKPAGKTRKLVVALIGGGVCGGLASAGFLIAVESGAMGALNSSRLVAGLVAVIYLLTALMVGIGLVNPSFGAKFLNVEDADELREQRLMLMLSTISMLAFGAALMVIALAGPGAAIGAGAGLTGFLILLTMTTVAGWRQMRYTDELMKSLSQEASALAFYLLFVIGGGWAVLAHLGFVIAPAPLDWLSMFAAILLLSTFIAAGKRGMMQMR